MVQYLLGCDYMNNKINILKEYIESANNIVVFTGAGVSTESGIKDFRSKDGLYNQKYKYPPETILSHHFFINNTKDFYEFYKEKMNCTNALPNYAHKYFYKLEQINKLTTIITQNIDNLHTKAGNTKVIELHGNITRNYCLKCHKFYDESYIFNTKDIPTCTCGGIIKPDVVLYEEALNEHDITNTIKAIKQADLLIIAGTSLSVYPASSFVNFFQGKHLVIINQSTTYMDSRADLIINDKVAKVFEQLDNATTD